MWGTGASSTQTEGAAPASDYLRWERAGKAPTSGDGNGFGSRYAEDFAILAELGLTHHRLSIEWARIEPEEGKVDEAEVERYRAILSAAHDAGVAPWICLHHFTLPTWFADKDAFLVESNRTTYWARHVDRMAELFGDLAYGWQPVNETNYYARICYRGTRFPPGHDDRAEELSANKAIHLATAEAAVRLKQTGKPVTSIIGLSGAVAADDDPASADAADFFYESSWGPGIGLHRDGVLRIPGIDPIDRPDLAGCFDLIGFSYYATMGFGAGKPQRYPSDAPQSPLGYSIWADGLGIVLDKLHADVPDTPVLVAEYGVGTDDDTERVAYVKRGLEMTNAAIEKGIDVRGFFHWTAVDNYEWAHGYNVSFGIIDQDRSVRPSARVLQAEAKN